MGAHALPASRPEPVATAAAVQAVLAALVTFGWVQLDDATVAAAATVVAAAVSAVLTARARARVTPTADPRAADGAPLIPAPEAVTDAAAATPVTALLRREGRI